MTYRRTYRTARHPPPTLASSPARAHVCPRTRPLTTRHAPATQLQLVRKFVHEVTPSGLEQQLKDAMAEEVRTLARSMKHTVVYSCRSGAAPTYVYMPGVTQRSPFPLLMEGDTVVLHCCKR